MKYILDKVIFANFTLRCVQGHLPFGEGGTGVACSPALNVRSALRDMKTSG
jgi:hypothetical protein